MSLLKSFSLLLASGVLAVGTVSATPVRLGVISDTHVSHDRPEAARTELGQVLAHFREQKVDAVIHCGDVTDFGYADELGLFAEIWRSSMPTSIPLVVALGNRDLSDTARMPEDIRRRDARKLIRSHLPDALCDVLGQVSGDGFRVTDVGGVKIVCSDWGKQGGIEEFLEAHPECRDPRSFMIYVQHRPPMGLSEGLADSDDPDPVTCALNMYPNVVAFSGHSHETFTTGGQFVRHFFTAAGAGCCHVADGPCSARREVMVLTLDGDRAELVRSDLKTGYEDVRRWARDASFDVKPLKPDEGTFRFLQWNACGFSRGTPAARRKALADLNADWIGVCECSSAGVADLDGYPSVGVGPKNGSNCNALLSRAKAVSDPAVHLFARSEQKRNWLRIDYDVNGRTVSVFQAHLDLTDERPAQIAELAKAAASCTHAIVAGDFNVSDLAEYRPFAAAGFAAANGGAFGIFRTHRKRRVSYSPAVDNVFVRGLELKDVFTFDDDCRLSDHRMLVADFSLCGVATVVDCGGIPRMAINGKPVSGTAVMPTPRVSPFSSVETLKKFDAAGIRLFSDVWTMRRPQPVRQWWLGEGKYDFRLFDDLARGMLAATPTGFVIPRIKLEPPDEWIAAHMDQMCVWEPDAPGKLRRMEVRPDSEPWRRLYRQMLRDMIAHVRESDYADRIVGYHLGAFHCGEWHVYPAPNIDVPESNQDPRDPLPPWETTVARQAFFEKWSNAIADDLIDAAGLVRRLTGGRKLIGAFFGYWGMTHERLHRVLESGQVDFFAAPPDYGELREPGHPGRSQAFCQSSFRLHGKMFYEESDFRTALSDFGDGLQTYKTRPLEQSVGILRRTIGKCLSGGWENWWFLLGGNRSFDAPEMMETIRRGVELSRETLGEPWHPAEVAVFTALDEYFTSTSADATETFGDPIKNRFHEEELPRAGVPFDSYDLADIGDQHLPDYRVYVFPNPFSVSEDRRKAILEHVRRPGKTAIWVYAPGYFRNGIGSAKNVSDLTGLEIEERFPVADGPYVRRFSARRNKVTLEDGSTSVFFPLPPRANELREAFRAAGVHVWVDTPDVLTAGRGFVMLHASSNGEKSIRLPVKANVEEVFGADESQQEVCEIRVPMKLGETRVYRIR